jgi:hypothetical protein
MRADRDEECPKLYGRPDLARLDMVPLGTLGPLDGVARDQLVNEHGITERLTQDRVSAHHGRDAQRLAFFPTASDEVAVQLGDLGRADGLETQAADVGFDVKPNHGPVAGQDARFDLDRVRVDPLVEVVPDRDGVPVDVLAASGFDACLVAGGLGVGSGTLSTASS